MLSFISYTRQKEVCKCFCCNSEIVRVVVLSDGNKYGIDCAKCKISDNCIKKLNSSINKVGNDIEINRYKIVNHLGQSKIGIGINVGGAIKYIKKHHKTFLIDSSKYSSFCLGKY